MDGFLTVVECAKWYRISPATVRRLIESGRLPAVRVGRSIRIPHPDGKPTSRNARKGVARG